VRKRLLLLVVIATVFAACGKAKESNVNLGVTSATPGTTASAKPGATAAAKTSAKPGSTKAPTGGTSSSGSTGSTTTPKPAPPGKANPPKDGSYAYRSDGNTNSPSTGPQSYSNQTITTKISHSGNVYSSEQSTNQGTVTSRDQWNSANIQFLSVKIESPYGTFTCTYNPPLVIAKFPIKPETFPQQKLQGSGNACGGTLDISVLDKENVQDATGHTWSAWKLHVKINSSFKYNGQPVSSSSDEMRWFSPDLGIEVKSIADTSNSSPLGKATGHATTVLKSHP
jgi:hypothetical protein